VNVIFLNDYFDELGSIFCSDLIEFGKILVNGRFLSGHVLIVLTDQFLVDILRNFTTSVSLSGDPGISSRIYLTLIGNHDFVDKIFIPTTFA
jgi:hypothetical protein